MGGVGKALFGSPSKSKSTSTSSSGNYSYPLMVGAYGPAMGYTTAAGNMMGNLLGLNYGSGLPTPTPAPSSSTGVPVTNPVKSKHPLLDHKRGIETETPAPTPAPTPTPTPATGDATANQNAALENWANSGGMKFLMDQGVNALESSQAGKGMLQSGATGKALTKFGQNLGSTYLNQYMDQLYKQAQLGIQAGGLVSGSGGWSNGTNTSTGSGGKNGMAGQLAQAAAYAIP